MTRPFTPRRGQFGVTLIEAMMVLAVVSIAIGAALPSFASLRQRADLTGVAAQVETDVQFARGPAVALNRTVQLTLCESTEGTCYFVHTGPAADCTCSAAAAAPASCGGSAELLRAVAFASQGPVQVRSASKTLTFDPVKGTVTPTATLRVEGKDGQAVHQVVNLLGRVRSCSPNGRVAGERAC
jgi:type IV fimbrial biogenesis protein FimT